jgi:hypothetical protein
MQGRWPQLSSFEIALSSYDSDTHSYYPLANDLGEFLSAHPSIARLGIYPHSDSPGPGLVFIPTALPYLTSFIGPYQHLSKLPNPHSVKVVNLLQSRRAAEAEPALMFDALHRLRSLRHLEISLADVTDIPLLRNIVRACSSLMSLNVSYATGCNLVRRRYALHQPFRLIISVHRNS